MALKDSRGEVDLTGLQAHLSEALDRAESDSTKYHLREAYQKVVFLADDERE